MSRLVHMEAGAIVWEVSETKEKVRLIYTMSFIDSGFEMNTTTFRSPIIAFNSIDRKFFHTQNVLCYFITPFPHKTLERTIDSIAT